jgi:hypothetical protein
VFVAIAVHYATPEHTDDMLAFMHRVIDRTTGAPGLIEFKACHVTSRRALAGYSRWNSQADFEAALPTIASLRTERSPEWCDQPDEVITLEVP